MFLTTKLNLLSGMIISASAVLLMEMCRAAANKSMIIDINTTPHRWSRSKILFPKKISRQEDLANGSP